LECGYCWRTSELKQEPEEIPDTEHERVLERVCAIDVAKDSGKVCVRVSSRAGRRVSKVWDVAARSGAVAELAENLVDEGDREGHRGVDLGLLADLVLRRRAR
jgi:hypothetical protein